MLSVKRLLEQVQEYGIEHFSDADLLSLVISKGSASERESAIKRIQTLLTECGGFNGVLNTDVAELCQFEMSQVSALRLRAVLELARRLSQPPQKNLQIKCPNDIVRLLAPDMRHLDHEEMRVLVLDTRNYVVANIRLYQGTVNSSCVRAAEFFRLAITRKCPSIILCHNHPSGDATPSPEDKDVTRQCVDAGKLLDIELLDHIIIGHPRFTSLKQTMDW